MRIVGLDVGEKRVGVAVSDPLGKTAQPLKTIRNDDRVMDRLGGLLSELGAERVVVGLPLGMAGVEGKQAGSVRRFAGELEKRVGIPVTFIDERLTTKEANAALRGGGLKGAGKKEAADRVAAALILSKYLEARPDR